MISAMGSDVATWHLLGDRTRCTPENPSGTLDAVGSASRADGSHMGEARASREPSRTIRMSMLSGDARSLSYDAYIYLYPLVTMEVTRRQSVNTPDGVKPGFGAPNAFHHLRAFPAAEFRAVVRPNFDTLYSSAWLDLTAGPVVISAPDTSDRYYLLPVLDMWTDVFASPGKRTTGTGAASYAVAPLGWSGELPSGVERIDAPTAHVWIIGRTQTNGPKDYDAV